jgi:hypothetical protein
MTEANAESIIDREKHRLQSVERRGSRGDREWGILFRKYVEKMLINGIGERETKTVKKMSPSKS